jgi:hypothetical protein
MADPKKREQLAREALSRAIKTIDDAYEEAEEDREDLKIDTARNQGQEYLNSLAWDKGKEPGEAEYMAALKAAKEGMGDEFSQEAFDARWNAKFFHPDRATSVSPTTKILTRGPY